MANHQKEMILDMMNRIRNDGNNSGHTTGEASGNTGTITDCSYKSFVGCKPPSFSGVEGSVELIQWLEKIETTLDISGCPEHHKVRYVAGSFSKRALTWWNSQIRARGRDEALAMPWADFKILLRNEFCPKHELQSVYIYTQMPKTPVENYNGEVTADPFRRMTAGGAGRMVFQGRLNDQIE
ncbi:hypothetical protein R6Q57_002423 [Mikania cordata]